MVESQGAIDDQDEVKYGRPDPRESGKGQWPTWRSVAGIQYATLSGHKYPQIAYTDCLQAINTSVRAKRWDVRSNKADDDSECVCVCVSQGASQ